MSPHHSRSTHNPTPHPEVNAILGELLAGARAILGRSFVGMYLNGSLAVGDFDEHSDIDFIIVTDDMLPGDAWAALQELHARLHAGDSHWATHLEGSYYPRHALRKYDPAHARHPWLEHGQGRLELMDHDICRGVVQRWITRECGLVLAGPAPDTLIDPVSADDLRKAIASMLRDWLPPLLDEPARINNRWYQAYIVLSLCRILYTLHHGTIVSKLKAARWAEETLDRRWTGLIERARLDRFDPAVRARQPAVPEEVNLTIEFIRHVLAFDPVQTDL